MVGKLWSPTRFWVGVITVGVVASSFLWLPQIRSVPLGECGELRTMLMAKGIRPQDVRVLLGPPSVETGIHWEYSRVCLDAQAGTAADVAVLFREDRVLQVIY